MLHFQSDQAITDILADYFCILLRHTGIIGLIFTLLLCTVQRQTDSFTV